MQNIFLPNCKINLGLNIVAKRPDGYHNLETVFYPIPLRDSLELLEWKDGTKDEAYRLHLSGAPIAGNPADNLVVKVYLSLREEFDLPPLEIFLCKHIPMGAGLGGGSSDAAAMMTGLNELYQLNLRESDMERRMAKFGADCAFFVRNRPVFATGIGDQMENFNLSLQGKYIVLVKPNVFISTKEAYATVRPQPATHDLREALAQDMDSWRETVVNDFEASVFPNHPELPAIKQTLYDLGARYAAMSGSGSTLFGLFDRPVAEAHEVFKDHFVFTEKLLR